MSKNTPPQIAKKNKASILRSSAAESAASGQGGVEAVYADENVWITQKMMGLLYDVDVRTINYHLKKVFDDSELEENSVIRNFRITAADGKHYNLAAIIAVGYKVNSKRAVQFRKWRRCRQGQHGAGHLEGCTRRQDSEIRCGRRQELPYRS